VPAIKGGIKFYTLHLSQPACVNLMNIMIM